MALVNTSARRVDLRSTSKRSDSEYMYNETRANNEEVLKISEEKRKSSRRSVSLPSIDILLDEKPGWPFLKIAQVHRCHTRNVSVVNWVMSLPDRFPHHQQNLNSETSFVKKQLKDILKDKNKWFSYNVLKTATSDFSQENLIGKGGCSEVYKGVLKDGKGIAVKILKSSSKEAKTNFVHEIDIISSLSHQNISQLLGVCVQDNDLISVYNLSSKGSLEETLHGKQKEKHVLSWEERFNIAIGLAEALDYIHNQCSKPVIHRDVKTSNVLLSDELQPQLSDFGLSMWEPTTSSRYSIQGDVVGTFGYLAPEYFMYGKVSDKVDVYAFGVVLLELISGRDPISLENPKGEESLAMWAKPLIETGNENELLDPEIIETYDETEFQRMVLAATNCLTRSATHRPSIKQILRLLRGVDDVEKWSKRINEEENGDCFDDEVYPNTRAELHLSLAMMLEVEDDESVSISPMERSNNSLFSSCCSSRELQPCF
ncbi:receptor-like cytosolic serine/threonine-protein kinase RBK2 isoform X1 [Brassica rapa]|uniref:receptor-like cytosolic serine/threonine-protein kinase RBK2 isoform X2 n=1 Tax=Brassica campestris TaxID=3711 RepID=UPI00142D6BFC|nr:receptor-like cytosolic serine/threonine-protein kinase RBK2 isoform X2 [Brassica rapa]XP_033139782.1 receptor-like cytosolic serine/threonine-protein kinase RBK2 isoform X1 [Brassica rapa]XP_033139784.1 receptor-like cytosolic serine/threonine-protein kinase RBK2 isoform X1 [Brassica rapa]XP_033139788.1 receptor-like cytosolic serine/threonine-protein kinase RBK2 isoform X1 [Brassica rapa]XP_033139791.1 receptor-like cytosolic serine/threonine-protein kinase RBK2 isoform X1 [Brassica rapa]